MLLFFSARRCIDDSANVFISARRCICIGDFVIKHRVVYMRPVCIAQCVVASFESLSLRSASDLVICVAHMRCTYVFRATDVIAQGAVGIYYGTYVLLMI